MRAEFAKDRSRVSWDLRSWGLVLGSKQVVYLPSPCAFQLSKTEQWPVETPVADFLSWLHGSGYTAELMVLLSSLLQTGMSADGPGHSQSLCARAESVKWGPSFHISPPNAGKEKVFIQEYALFPHSAVKMIWTKTLGISKATNPLTSLWHLHCHFII